MAIMLASGLSPLTPSPITLTAGADFLVAGVYDANEMTKAKNLLLPLNGAFNARLMAVGNTNGFNFDLEVAGVHWLNTNPTSAQRSQALVMPIGVAHCTCDADLGALNGAPLGAVNGSIYRYAVSDWTWTLGTSVTTPKGIGDDLEAAFLDKTGGPLTPGAGSLVALFAAPQCGKFDALLLRSSNASSATAKVIILGGANI